MDPLGPTEVPQGKCGGWRSTEGPRGQGLSVHVPGFNESKFQKPQWPQSSAANQGMDFRVIWRSGSLEEDSNSKILNSCGTWGKLLHFSVLQFPHLCNGDINRTYYIGSVGKLNCLTKTKSCDTVIFLINIAWSSSTALSSQKPWKRATGASFVLIFGLLSSVPEVTSGPQRGNRHPVIHNNPFIPHLGLC